MRTPLVLMLPLIVHPFCPTCAGVLAAAVCVSRFWARNYEGRTIV